MARFLRRNSHLTGDKAMMIGLVNMAITDKMNTVPDVANDADEALYFAKKPGGSRL